MNNEPALIIGAISSLIAVAVGFGLKITPEQVGLILAAVNAVAAVITRRFVTPTATIPPVDPNSQGH